MRMHSKGDEPWESLGLQLLTLALWLLESNGTGWAWLRLVPPTCQSSQMTRDMGRRGNDAQQNGTSHLHFGASSVGCKSSDISGGAKGHKPKTCCLSHFSQISMIWSQSRNYLETLKKWQLNGNRERWLKLSASYFDGTRGI